METMDGSDRIFQGGQYQIAFLQRWKAVWHILWGHYITELPKVHIHLGRGSTISSKSGMTQSVYFVVSGMLRDLDQENWLPCES